jgi:hypothetical protein
MSKRKPNSDLVSWTQSCITVLEIFRDIEVSDLESVQKCGYNWRAGTVA